MPAATTFRADEYPGATDVSIQVDANPVAYCTSDADADGCVLAGNTLTVGAPAITSVAAGSTVVVRSASPSTDQDGNRKANHP